MAKRLSIPKTPAEAERFLWHALYYIGEYPMKRIDYSDAEDLFHQALERVRGEEIWTA